MIDVRYEMLRITRAYLSDVLQLAGDQWVCPNCQNEHIIICLKCRRFECGKCGGKSEAIPEAN